MEEENSGDVQILPELVNEDFEKKTLFGMGQEVRTFWPHDVSSAMVKRPALTLSEWGLKNNEIIFELKTDKWIDPYSMSFNFWIQNNSYGEIGLDHSIHSLFSSIIIYINGNEVERMENYPLLSKLYFDMSLTLEEKNKRSVYEGFSKGVNGVEETIIEKWDPKIKSQVSKVSEMCNVESNKITNSTSWGREFKMPLMSKYFGLKVEPKNWKLIPMKAMVMTIKMTTNKYAFFRPIRDEQTYNTATVTIDNVKIIRPELRCIEYTFTKEFDEKMFSRFLYSPLTFDYIDYEIIDKYAMTKETADLSLKVHVKERKQAVRGLIFIVLDSSYIESPCVKPLAYLNMGFSRMQIFTENGSWPNDRYFEDWEINNAQATCGASVKKLFKDIKFLQHFNETNPTKRKELLDSKNTIDEKGLARKYDYTTLNGKTYGENNSVLKTSLIHARENKDGDCNFGGCSTMLVLKFDNIPKNNVKMVSGIQLDAFKDYIIQLKKNESSITTRGYEYLKAKPEVKKIIDQKITTSDHIYKTSYVIAQVYRRDRMTVDGIITEVELR